MGLGGSAPSFYQDYATSTKEGIYFPFPYKSEGEIHKDLEALIGLTDNGKQVIVLTHDGPL